MASRVWGGVDYGLLSAMLGRVLEVSEDSGAVAAGTTTTLTDPTKGWAANDWASAKVHIVHKGVEYVRTISSNTENTLVFSPALPEAPSAGDPYMIRRVVAPYDMTKWGGTALTGRDISADLANLNRITPVLKGSVFNSSVTANTDIFPSDLAPTNSPTMFRIYACFSASGVLTVRRTRAGTTVGEQLNGGAALAANAAYTWDVVVESGESVNLQYSVDATALKLAVLEVPGVIS